MMPSAVRARGRNTGGLGRWLAVSTGAVVFGALLAPGPAQAAMEIMPADNAEHDYCLASSFTTAPALAHTAMTSALDGPTDMTALFRNGCGSGPRGNSTVDVWFIETTLGPGVRGERFCQVPISRPGGTFVCDTADVRIDYANIAAGGGPQPENREKTVVHEVGHSVGLADHSHTCAMRQGAITDTALNLRRYAAADITLINANY